MLPGSVIAQVTNQVDAIPVTGTILTPPGGTFAGTLDITRFAVQNGALVALGDLSGTLRDASSNIIGTVTDVAVALPVTSLVPDPGSCTILDLTLGPLNLTLLGLEVQLSQVDLLITANPGQGLLGDLLCALSNLLNQNATLRGIAALLNVILGILQGL